ncbi:hypothetical protein SB861_07310 [Paraburkholderia sp. SIMBA_049]
MARKTLEGLEAIQARRLRESALRHVLVAATMLEDDEARALISMSAEELGQTLQSRMIRTIPIARRVRLELQKSSQPTKASVQKGKRPQADAKLGAWDAAVDQGVILKARQALVRSKKLLPAASIWEGLGVTKQALSKAVASGRIFTVDVGAATYYPAFYLETSFDRKQLAKVTQILGSLPGWSKWQFLTTPSNFLGQITPLKALALGKVEEVRQAALGFVER